MIETPRKFAEESLKGTIMFDVPKSMRDAIVDNIEQSIINYHKQKVQPLRDALIPFVNGKSGGFNYMGCLDVAKQALKQTEEE